MDSSDHQRRVRQATGDADRVMMCPLTVNSHCGKMRKTSRRIDAADLAQGLEAAYRLVALERS